MADDLRTSIKDGLLRDTRIPKVGDVVRKRYRLRKVLGVGGFAVVFQALDRKTGGIVALKVLAPEKSRDADFKKRFSLEVNLVARLRHHNTIKVWDASISESGCLYMATEFVEGEELHTVIRKTGGIALNRVVRIAKQVLRSLAEAHKAGIVHRDLKPANIMVCQLEGDKDYVKVLDFGIAKVVSGTVSMVETRTGNVMCTPTYAAPEVLRERNIQPASDIYSLGLVLLEAITGQTMVSGSSMVDIIMNQVSDDEIPLPNQLRGIALGTILSKATSKVLSERYQTALEMLADLNALPPQPDSTLAELRAPALELADESSTQLLASGPAQAKPKLDPKESGRGMVLMAVVGAAVVALVAALLLLPGGSEPEPLSVTPPVPPEPTQEVAAAEPAGQNGEVEDRAETYRDPLLDRPGAFAARDEALPPRGMASSDEGTNARATPPRARARTQSPPEDQPLLILGDVPDPTNPNHWTRIRLDSVPPGEIFYDGNIVGETPFDGVVVAQSHSPVIWIRKDGHRPGRVAIDMIEGDQSAARVLQPLAEGEDPSHDSPPARGNRDRQQRRDRNERNRRRPR